MNSNIRSVCNNYIHNTESKNTESGDLNQRIPNQEIRTKQYQIMVSEKWGNWTLQLIICSFWLVWKHYISQDLCLGILKRLSHTFLGSLWLILWPFARNHAIFTRFAWLSVYFEVVYVILVIFWFVWWTWDQVLCISSTNRGNWWQNQVETKKSSQTQANLHLTCSYITPARPVS